MDCSIINKLLAAYADGTLDQQEKILIQDHLKHCQKCSAALKVFERYHKELASLGKVNPPADFLEQLHARMKPESGLKRALNLLLLPFQVKYSWRWASVVTLIIIITAVYKYVYPLGETAYVIPEARMGMVARKETKADVKRLSVRKGLAVVKLPKPSAPAIEAPIEIAMVLKPAARLDGGEGARGAAAPAPAAEMMEERASDFAGSAGMLSMKSIEKEEKLAPPDNTAGVKNLIKEVGGVIIFADSQTIVASLPAENYPAFLDKLNKYGEVNAPAVSKVSGDKMLRIRIKIVPLNTTTTH